MLFHGNNLVKAQQGEKNERNIKVWKQGPGVRGIKKKAAHLLDSASTMLIGNKQELIVWRALNQTPIKEPVKG